MGEVRRTLIPQFSLRLILGIVSGLAVVAFVTSTAGRGWAWAAGVSIGLLANVVAFAVYALLFAVVWILARLLGPLKSKGRPGATKSLIVGWIALNLFLLGRAVWGASGGSITLPVLTANQVNTIGLELTLDTTWVDSFGYRPVRVSVRSIAGPTAADRALTVRFRPRSGYTNQGSVAVSQVVELAAGSSETHATISVPQDSAWGSFELEVFEDGRYVDPLSIGPNAGWTSWSGTEQGDRALPVILFLGDASRGKVSVKIGDSSPEELIAEGDGRSGAAVAAANQGFAQRDSISIGDLPTRWIDYSGVDIVICSQAKWRELNEQFPATAKAIQDWLRNGGNLVVYGAGKDWQRIADLERALGLLESDAAVVSDANDVVKRGWNLPATTLRTTELMQAAPESMPTDYVGIGSAPFVARRCGRGMVAAIPGDDTFDGRRFRWIWLFNTLGPERWQWSQRNGVSMARENGDFWNFLIPGVGLAPVTQFQVFITLFMLAIGPVNYFVLRRWGKLNLMVITVPAGALVVTLGLIGAALVADGLGVRVRARSVTTIDQRSGEAACWARLSYYAGLAPGGGLKFSEETAVLPLEAEPDREEDKRLLRVVDWTRRKPGDAAAPLEQRLADGWLAARTPTQFVTARIGRTAAKVEVRQAEAGKPPGIVNHLGASIKQLVLIDESGNCFVGAGVPKDGSADLKSATSQHEAFEPIEALLSANQPEVPAGMSYNSGSRSFFGLGGRYRNRYPYGYGSAYPRQLGNSGASAASQTTGLLERTILETAERFRNDKALPRSYVAAVETPPEVELGTAAAREEASFHLVVGRW